MASPDAGDAGEPLLMRSPSPTLLSLREDMGVDSDDSVGAGGVGGGAGGPHVLGGGEDAHEMDEERRGQIRNAIYGSGRHSASTNASASGRGSHAALMGALGRAGGVSAVRRLPGTGDDSEEDGDEARPSAASSTGGAAGTPSMTIPYVAPRSPGGSLIRPSIGGSSTSSLGAGSSVLGRHAAHLQQHARGASEDSRSGMVGVVFLHRLPDLIAGLGIFTIFLCAVLYYSLGHDSDLGSPPKHFIRVVTISRTGCRKPEQLVFTTGLHLLGMLAAVFFYLVYLVYYYRCLDAVETIGGIAGRNAMQWNNRIFTVGMTCAIALFFTGSLPLCYAWFLHVVAASISFLFGCLHAVLHCAYVAAVVKTASKSSFRARVAVSALGVISLLFYMIVLSIVSSLEDCQSGDDNDDDSSWCAVTSVKNMFEYLLVLCFMLYVWTFKDDIRGFTATVSK